MDKMALTVSDLVAGNNVDLEENSARGKEVRGWQPSSSDGAVKEELQGGPLPLRLQRKDRAGL